MCPESFSWTECILGLVILLCVRSHLHRTAPSTPDERADTNKYRTPLTHQRLCTVYKYCTNTIWVTLLLKMNDEEMMASPWRSNRLQSRHQCGWLQHKDVGPMESCQKDNGLFHSSLTRHQISYTPPARGWTGTYTSPWRPARVRSRDTLKRWRGREDAREDDKFWKSPTFVFLFCFIKYVIQAWGGWGHLRNGSRSAVSCLVWIWCCTTVRGLNWWQLREQTANTSKKICCLSSVSEFVYLCEGLMSMSYLQLTATVVSSCCVLHPRCVQAPWWPSQVKHWLLTTVRL